MSALALQLRSFARSGLRQPVFGVLAVLGVALGVAVVTAVDRAIDASRRNLEASVDLLAGPFSHHVVGGVGGVDEALYRVLRVELGVRRAMPVVEGAVTLARDGQRARLVGVDLTASLAGDGPTPPWMSEFGSGALEGAPLLPGARSVVLSKPSAERLGVAAGERLPLMGDGPHAPTVAAVLEVPAREAAAWDGLLLADIATAQEVLGRQGQLTRVDLSPDAAQLQALSDGGLLPPGTELLTREQRAANLLDLSQSFHLNLTALSLLTLLVGAMLIFNTETFLVVRRRRELAILRTMGVTSREIFVAVLLEACALGVIGTLLGLLAGSALAQLMMGLMGRTSADLYTTVSASLPSMGWGQLARLSALGVGVSVLAAVLPAREAVRGATVEHLRNHDAMPREAQGLWARLAMSGLAAIALGLMLVLATPGQVTAAFVGLFLLLLGFTAQAPLLAQRLFSRPSSRAADLSLQRLAVRNVGAHLHRSAPALAALIVALGTSLGITLMIASFERAVVSWLDSVLAADYYVAGEQPRVITQQDVASLGELPGVAEVSTVRWNSVETATGHDRIVAYALNDRARRGFILIEGEAERFWPRFVSAPVVMVTQTLAYKRRLKVGDRITLRTGSGERAFEVGAVYRDYGSEHGTIAMSEATFAAHFPTRETVEGIGIYLDPGADRAVSEAALTAWVEDQQRSRTVLLRSRESLIAISLEVFARTFTITEVLRVLAALVAFAGTVNALLALLLDRYAQFAVMRALGVTPNEIARLLLTESGALGAFAGLCAIPAGLLIGLMLIYVVNVRSFGWTMTPHFAVTPMLGTLVLAVLASVLAAVWPAWRLRQRLQASDLTPGRA
ncbi:MAG: FtsX-like permease family protein [Pseudomonadota bacterium]